MRLRKVKGHATDDMVDEGKVEGHEKLGNDEADIDAGKRGRRRGQKAK